MPVNDTTRGTMNAMRTRYARPFTRGFTLVELMIAMALVGALTALIYGLFVRTSDALTDVEGLSGALDQARFGLDHVRTDLQGAGSQMTSNAEADPWFAPNDKVDDGDPKIRVHGVMGYSGWDNGASEIYTGDLAELGTENPRSNFSGFVVLGAYTVPSSFHVSFPQGADGDALNHAASGSNPTFVVESTERGLLRFTGYDPFDVRVQEGVNIDGDGLDIDDDSESFQAALIDIAEDSLLRVTNLDGFSQVTPVTSASFEQRRADEQGSGAGRVHDPGYADDQFDEFDLEVANIHFTSGDEPAGFDPYVEDDVSFNAALIDAFWYYVRPAPDDARNFQLVRHRVDADALINGAEGLSESDLAGMAADNTPMIIAENVVDFRVWFSCRGSGQDVLTNANWSDDWEPDGDDCIGDNPRDAEPERARFAHARLSTRTERENSNRPHYTVVNNWEGFEVAGDAGGQMRTYNLVPHAEGSAGVVTTQASVELTNFAMRNVRD